MICLERFFSKVLANLSLFVIEQFLLLLINVKYLLFGEFVIIVVFAKICYESFVLFLMLQNILRFFLVNY